MMLNLIIKHLQKCFEFIYMHDPTTGQGLDCHIVKWLSSKCNPITQSLRTLIKGCRHLAKSQIAACSSVGGNRGIYFDFGRFICIFQDGVTPSFVFSPAVPPSGSERILLKGRQRQFHKRRPPLGGKELPRHFYF